MHALCTMSHCSYLPVVTHQASRQQILLVLTIKTSSGVKLSSIMMGSGNSCLGSNRRGFRFESNVCAALGRCRHKESATINPICIGGFGLFLSTGGANLPPLSKIFGAPIK